MSRRPTRVQVKELEPILEKAPIWGRLYADKGYASCANKQLLKESKSFERGTVANRRGSSEKGVEIF